MPEEYFRRLDDVKAVEYIFDSNSSLIRKHYFRKFDPYYQIPKEIDDIAEAMGFNGSNGIYFADGKFLFIQIPQQKDMTEEMFLKQSASIIYGGPENIAIHFPMPPDKEGLTNVVETFLKRYVKDFD